MKNYFIRLWKDDLGQSTTEYILILSVVVMVAMKFRKGLQGQLERLMGNVDRDLQNATSGDSGN